MRSNSSRAEARPPIHFVDLAAQQERIRPQLNRAIGRVLEHGQYIGGPEVQLLEEQLASFCGVDHCVTCANGTDALTLILRGLSIGRDDAVFVPSFTFAATAEAVCLVGATPVFCDVRQSDFNLDPESLLRAIVFAQEEGLTPRAVMAVDLYGQPADYSALQTIVADHGLLLLADAAQSLGASFLDQRVGSLCEATATSFFPSKPLACYGDGGAVFTSSDDLARTLRSLRAHGAGRHRYDHERVGTNSRLDTLQAAILIEKLAIFPEELVARQAVADRYSAKLEGVTTPGLRSGATSAWAQYTIVTEHREAILRHTQAWGIPTAIHYPLPLPDQAAFMHQPVCPDGIPTSKWLADRVLSLPMHPYLTEADQETIIGTINQAIDGALPSRASS